MKPFKQSQGVTRLTAAPEPAEASRASAVVPSDALSTIQSAITTYGPTVACAICRSLCGS